MLESRTDYYQLLSEAFGPSVPDTRAARKKIYDGARKALKEQAKLVQHRFDLAAEMKALEKAILDVEISAKRGQEIPRWMPGTKPPPRRLAEPFIPPSMQKQTQQTAMAAAPVPSFQPGSSQACTLPPQSGGPRIEWADPSALPQEEQGTYLPPASQDPLMPPPLPPTSPVRRQAGPSFQPAFLNRADRISYARQTGQPPKLQQARQPPLHPMTATVPLQVPMQAPDAIVSTAPAAAAASLNIARQQKALARLNSAAAKPPRGGLSEKTRARLRTMAIVIFAACLGGVIAYVVKPEQLIRQLIAEYGSSPEPATPAPPASSTGASISIDEPRKPGGDDLVQLAIQKTGQRDYAGALAILEEARKLGVKSADFYQARAYANWGSGDIDRAIADYGEAIRAEPGVATHYSNRAVAYNTRGDYLLAIRDLERAIAIDPSNPDIWNSRCWARALAGQTQEAILDCNESLRLRPNDPNTLDSRGFAYLKAGQNARAIADFDAVLKISPQVASSLYGRGLARMRTGERTRGTKDMEDAKAISPSIDEQFAKFGVR